MKEFKKIVVLDNLLLFREHKATLGQLGEEVVYYPSSTPETIRQAVRNRDRHSAAGLLGTGENPQCATELGIEALAEQELAERVKGADCVLTCWTGIPPNILDQNPQLRYLGFWTHDKNKVGVPEAETQGVTVTYVPDYGTTAVAELVFAGILNLARDIHRHEKNTIKGKWPYEQFKKGEKKAYVSVNHEPTPDDIREFTLEGKTLGIVGMGRIGQDVARKAKYGFDMDVVYASRTRRDDLEAAHGYRFAGLDEVMGSDIVSVHVPPDAPRHLINAGKIREMKNDAIFVNTSVGHAVDQVVLLGELRTGRISAYLDVFDGLPPRRELKGLQRNVLSTYRAGWYTRDSVTKKGNTFMQHLMNYVNRQKNKNI
jgi:lactate dehydrogenase-like 2-hydroxyacid dehydrogenase